MAIKKEIEWNCVINGVNHTFDKVTFTKAMLIIFIGQWWYDYFFDDNDNFRYKLDKIIGTSREVGKTTKLTIIAIYLLINKKNANFVFTRKYATAAGSFYENFSKILNRFEDMFKITWSYKFYETYTTSSGKERRKLVKEIINLKGKGQYSLFSYGKDGSNKSAIFYNDNYNNADNQIIFLRGADDADGSRGISPNKGYIVFILLEEYSQEVDEGKLEPEVQVKRYRSLWKSSNRYSIDLSNTDEYPNDLRTAQIAMANIWDRDHEYNVNLINAITEKEWREFVESNPNENYVITRTIDGITYMRATPASNFFLYPEGSEQRKELLQQMKDVIASSDDYAKAELLGYTFPGFLKSDNPLIDVIEIIKNADEMSLEELINGGFDIEEVQFGTDPGLRDDTVSIPCYFIKNYTTNEDGLYFDKMFYIENKKRLKNKLPRISNPMMKKQLLKFWNETIRKLPKYVERTIYANLDMKALGIRDDFNNEIFIKNEKLNEIKGICSPIPTSEKKGYGLEQRIEIASNVLKNSIWDPETKAKMIETLKTLKPYEGKVQPHPRKGKIDFYDALMYAIVKLRHNIT